MPVKKDIKSEFLPDNIVGKFSRRSFLNYSGVTLVGASLLTGCNDDEDEKQPQVNEVNLGTGDIGILNYAYALEQLEAAFYIKVVESNIADISADEKMMLTDIRDHEIAHREFFKNALGSNAIPVLTVDFNSVDFTKRDTVLATARVFEDLGVSAYNGAGKLIKNAEYLILAGKIVSVEARHAAFIRDLISNGSFADSSVIDNNGLDKSRKPSEVLSIAAPFIKNKINFTGLPQ